MRRVGLRTTARNGPWYATTTTSRTRRARPSAKPGLRLSPACPRKAISAWLAFPSEGRALHDRKMALRSPKCSPLLAVGPRYRSAGNGRPRRGQGIAMRTRRAHPSATRPHGFSLGFPRKATHVWRATPRRVGLRTTAQKLKPSSRDFPPHGHRRAVLS